MTFDERVQAVAKKGFTDRQARFVPGSSNSPSGLHAEATPRQSRRPEARAATSRWHEPPRLKRSPLDG